MVLCRLVRIFSDSIFEHFSTGSSKRCYYNKTLEVEAAFDSSFVK